MIFSNTLHFNLLFDTLIWFIPKEYTKDDPGSEGGLSLDLESADKEPKNQNWLFWNMKKKIHFNQFGLF